MWLHWVLWLTTLQGAIPPVDVLAHEVSAEIHVGEYAEARRRLERGLLVYPNNLVLLDFLGTTYADLGEIDAAIGVFEKLLVLTPGKARAYFNLGFLYARKGEIAKALVAYRQGFALDHRNVGASQDYALLLINNGQFKESIEPLLAVKRTNISDPAVRLALVNSYFKCGFQNEGQQEVDEFLSSGLARFRETLKLSRVLSENGELAKAKVVLEHALAASPNSAEAHDELGLLLAKGGQLEESAKELSRAAELAPNTADYALDNGAVLLLAKRYSDAASFLLRWKDRLAREPDYHYKLGLAYYGMRDYRQARSALESVAQLDPQHDLAQYYLGNCYHAAGDLPKAERHYRTAIRLNPNRASYYGSLGALLVQSENVRRAEGAAYLSRALELDPKDVYSRFELALYYEGNADCRTAQLLLEEVVGEEPELVRAHVALARVFFRQGMKEKGEREKAIVAGLETDGQGKDHWPADTQISLPK
jgi:tetratricopeptide (TPR) repeat protein